MNNFDVVSRLILAIVLGGAIGLEREAQNQPAGLRTHIILCVGSTLIMLLSLFMFYNIAPESTDPSRIAAQIVTGIGFLGAGAIMRLGVSVRGLTTAASLWTTAGIGMAVGIGFYVGALFTTFILLFALSLVSYWAKTYLSTKSSKSINLVVNDNPSVLGKIADIFNRFKIDINSFQFYRNSARGPLEIIVVVNSPGGFNVTKVSQALTAVEDIIEIDMQ